MTLGSWLPNMDTRCEWRKTEESGANACCVEALKVSDMVLVGDSKYRKGGGDPALQPVIPLRHAEWDRLLGELASSSRDADPRCGGLEILAKEDGSVSLVSLANRTVLSFTADEWRAFLVGVKLGEMRSEMLTKH